MSTAAAMSIAAACKGDASLASGRHHYRVNTRGDRRRDSGADDRLVYSLYYPLHDGRVAQIKEQCVDNAVGLDSQLQFKQQPEAQSKVNVLGTLPATTVEAAVQAEHRLNLAKSRETDRDNGYVNRSPVFSYERCPIVQKCKVAANSKIN